jgi:phage terminase large subunit-like protein
MMSAPSSTMRPQYGHVAVVTSREAVADRGELAPTLGSRWVAGLDPAFASDPFGLAIVGRDSREAGRLVLGAARRWTPERRKPVSFEEQRRVADAVLAEVAPSAAPTRRRP